jgi:hypothetical protein
MAEDTRSAIRNTLATGLLAVLGIVVGGVVKGCWDVQLAKQKLDSDLVLKAVSADSARDRAASLHFLLDAHLIQDRRIRDGLADYFEKNRNNPASVPQIGGSGLAAPTVPDARVFLLAGTAAKRDAFQGMADEFARAGFTVVGDKVLDDETRPLEPEVRYYNAADSAQATALAGFLSARLKDPSIRAQLCRNPTPIRDGYIELWAGGSAASRPGHTCS